MRQTTQENLARMFIPEFDCPLPPSVCAELLQPRRPRILTRPPGPLPKPPQVDSVRRWWHPAIGWLLALMALVMVIAVSWPTPEKRARALQESAARSREAEAKAAEALKALRSPTSQAPTIVQPTPAPTPASTPSAELRSKPSGVVPIPAPRAMLIRLPAPPPRAQLVRLPSAHVELVELVASHIDETHVITMPYGETIRATLRGFLESETQLPGVGGVGDMYVVGTTPWIWTTAPGATTPMWIDP